MQTLTLLLEAYVSNQVSFETACRWKKKFQTDTEFVQDTGKSGQLFSVSGTCIKIKDKMKTIVDSRYTIHDVPKAHGILLSQ